jgi:hypothetical protein
MPGASLHVELEVLRSCGIPNQELLVAVTSGIRRRLRRMTGGVHAGGRAEVLVLERDPRESITATTAIRCVLLGDLVLNFRPAAVPGDAGRRG